MKVHFRHPQFDDVEPILPGRQTGRSYRFPACNTNTLVDKFDVTADVERITCGACRRLVPQLVAEALVK